MHHTPSIGPLPFWTLFGEFVLRQLRPERPSRLSPSEFVRSDGGDTASLHGAPAAKTSRIACGSVARTLLAYVAYVSIRQHTSAHVSQDLEDSVPLLKCEKRKKKSFRLISASSWCD